MRHFQQPNCAGRTARRRRKRNTVGQLRTGTRADASEKAEAEGEEEEEEGEEEKDRRSEKKRRNNVSGTAVNNWIVTEQDIPSELAGSKLCIVICMYVCWVFVSRGNTNVNSRKLLKSQSPCPKLFHSSLCPKSEVRVQSLMEFDVQV